MDGSKLKLAIVMVFLCVGGLLSYAQRPEQQRRQSEGRVIERRLNELHRHPTPRPTPPGPRPQHPRGDRRYHWHPQYHRWLLFPVQQAPPTLVIPQTFALPQRIEVYEDQQSGCDLICPNCQKSIRVVLFPD